LDKINPEIELLVSCPSRKYGLTSVPITYIPISLIQNNPPTYFLSLFLSYKFPPFLPTPKSKKPIIEIEEEDNVDSDVKI